MSQSTEQQREENNSRVQVGNLPRQEKDVKDSEAAKVKGGAGAPGGVLNRMPGEEIPQ